MLPGFRLVVATVVLAVSLLVFGLGAAALLRASREQSAALPPAQAPRDPMLAREPEARQATLALLRVEMMAEQSEAGKTLADGAEEATPSPVAVVVSAPISPVRIDDAPARVETVASDAAPIAPRIVVGDAGDKLSPEPSASVEAGPVAAREDKAAPSTAQADSPGCVPALPPSELLALLVDPALLRPGAALKAAKPASLEGSAIHRVRRWRHRHARLRHHRLLLRAQAQAAPFAAQQNNPFGVFPAAR
ncbi:MAG: hypothetical protein P4M07_15585 [Xanthobacteraceae bacterium]|nr:hypothetical protein [Xanthobacteraceae bacterium]